MIPYRLILLDRDGVINADRPTSVLSPEDFVFLPGALDAIRDFTHAGLKVAVVTNQSVVGRGIITSETLAEIHELLLQRVRTVGGDIHHIFVCTDAPEAATHRRKPEPGMIEEALALFEVGREETCLIGDAPRDLQAAARAGIHRHLVLTGKGRDSLHQFGPHLLEACPFMVHCSLGDAAHFILKQ